MRCLSVRACLVVLGAMLLGSCADSRPLVGSPGAISDRPAGAVLSRKAWSFGETPGQVIRTEHYQIRTTEKDATIIARLPLFLETALTHYRNDFVSPGADPLPEPSGRQPLETFVFETRDEWASLTRQLMGENAETYLRIQRGGYAHAGRSVLFNLRGVGAHSTMAIASHEGWHQYTQRAFDVPLPLWIEEGIASYMEGHKWDGPTPVFHGWSNTERFDALRAAQRNGRLTSLKVLLNSRPADLLKGDSEAALVYYAQVWALTHFLREGDNGAYRENLDRLLHEAADGTLPGTLGRYFTTREVRSLINRRIGAGVFQAYFDADIEAADRRYQAFIREICRTGARNAIVAGRSPLGG